MFSKATLPIVSALISAVMASPIERAVADAIAANAQSEILFAPLPLVGTGNRLAKSAGQRTDFSLVQKDDLYWSYPSEKLLANATFTAKPAYKIANEQNFGDLVSSIDCADPKQLKVQLKNAASVADAKKAWAWVNQAEVNTLVYVTESGACGGTYGRQPFYITSADYEGNTATLDVRSAGDWKEFAEDASVHIGASNVDDESDIDKRLSYSDNVKISIEHTFTKHFYDADIGPAHLSVDCSDCGTFGSLLLDIKVSTGDGFEASATTADNVHARLAIAATASAAIKIGHSTGQLTIAEVPLPTFKIGGVVKIKPEIALKLSLSITDIAGSITAVVGAQLSIPDGQGIALGKGVDSIEPQFSTIGPTISGKVDVSARVGTLFTVNLSGDILGLDLIAGIDLNAPYLAATAGVYVGTPTACDPNSSIKLGLTAGGTLDTYYGKGKKGDQPHKKNIYNKDIPLIDECYPI